MSNTTDAELDEILEQYAESIGSYVNFGSPFNSDEDNIAGAEALYQTSYNEAKQAILDWHNKRIEAVLDRLEKQAKSLIRNPDGSSIGAEYIPLSAIEAERNKLKESTDEDNHSD